MEAAPATPQATAPVNAPTKFLYKIWPMNPFSGTHWYISYIQYKGEEFVEDGEHAQSWGEIPLSDIRGMIGAHLTLQQSITVLFIVEV